ncbi:MAG: hypothetical protein WC699_04050 [Bacteroidales bacterium]
MKNIDTRYWIELTLVTLSLIAIGWVTFIFFLPGLFDAILLVMLGVIVLMTVAGQAILTNLMDQNFSKFNSAFLIYKGAKILILMTFMVIYTITHRKSALPFLGGTFIIYLVYMFFEARSLNRQSRKQAER